MNDLTTTTPAEAFRAKAADMMIGTAKMTLHQLVDEFVRLTEVIEKNTIEGDDGYHRSMTDEGELAYRDRRMVTAAARSRFGVTFDSYDRNDPGSARDF